MTGCFQQSPYEPTNQNEIIVFGNKYFIVEQQVSDPGTIQISCPSDKYIYVFSAFHGLYFNLTNGPYSSFSNCPDVCYSRNYFDHVKSLSSNKQSFNFTDSIDPCQMCLKYFVVKYLCVDSVVLSFLNSCPKISTVPPEICPTLKNTSVNDQTWFNGYQKNGANVSCPLSFNIQILCVFYGYDVLNSKINPSATYTYISAYYKSIAAYDFVADKCNNQSICIINEISMNTDTFNAPNDQNILQIQWTCSNSNEAFNSSKFKS